MNKKILYILFMFLLLSCTNTPTDSTTNNNNNNKIVKVSDFIYVLKDSGGKMLGIGYNLSNQENKKVTFSFKDITETDIINKEFSIEGETLSPVSGEYRIKTEPQNVGDSSLWGADYQIADQIGYTYDYKELCDITVNNGRPYIVGTPTIVNGGDTLELRYAFKLKEGYVFDKAIEYLGDTQNGGIILRLKMPAAKGEIKQTWVDK
ncbi:hypothetical protein [Brachyspira pilosicoli]|uniref:Lipoprotein n=1 Tax=Brachyspira pilosicoli TaxID=52584 RepID=A0A5C8ET44_BRAPL|nr:hypothetical protein [Brachyspira pilosicoli]TXJ41045.1 hypothetical protein EPJ72_07570 [Brachyspira pilosicoli]